MPYALAKINAITQSIAYGTEHNAFFAQCQSTDVRHTLYIPGVQSVQCSISGKPCCSFMFRSRSAVRKPSSTTG